MELGATKSRFRCSTQELNLIATWPLALTIEMDAFFSDTLVKFAARLMDKHAGKSLKIVTTCDFSVGLRSKKFTQATQAAPSQDGLKLLGRFESPKGIKRRQMLDHPER